jgi:UDP-4-amino-4,6-dideoxy-N-acetyl-beta-L-altrosamine transaminase
MIPYGIHEIDQADIDLVVKVLKSDFITQGPLVSKFEEKVSDYCCAKYGVAVNSATSALHVACLALKLSSGDRVWTSANTFVASANCALYCGADVDFVDIDMKTYNISIASLEEKLKVARLENKLPKIVIPVHYAGQSCDMKSIFKLSKEYGFKIIEDASHALGGKYCDQKIGGCYYSDVTIFSFHPVKMITSGEGGIALTNDKSVAEDMFLYRTHGITRNQDLMKIHTMDEICDFQQIELGFNYRMTDIHAALGVSQMRKIKEFVKKRKKIAKYYDEAFFEEPLTTPWQHLDASSSYHLYPVRIDKEQCGKSQRHVYDEMRKNGIGVSLHYMPVYLHPYYQSMGFKIGYCPNAEYMYKQLISLPIYTSLKVEDQDYIVHKIKEVLK